MQVGSEQNQFEWHTTLQAAIEKTIAAHMEISNRSRVEVLTYIDHFLWNGDETCFMVGADGRVRVLYGSARRKNHELVLTDSRFSITCYRCGSAAGVQGPFVFVMKCANVPALWTPEFLVSLGAPLGSMVLPSLNAFMTDEVWAKISKVMPSGMRQCDVIMKEHPELPFLKSVDGFASHTNSSEAIAEYVKANGELVLESGNGSHIFQAYDQDVAKKDKANEKELTQILVSRGKRMPDQWDLLAVVLSACTGAEYSAAWQSSFQKVNFVGNYVPWPVWKTKRRIKEAFMQADARFLASRSPDSHKRSVAKLKLLPPQWKSLSSVAKDAVIALALSPEGETPNGLHKVKALTHWNWDQVGRWLTKCVTVELEVRKLPPPSTAPSTPSESVLPLSSFKTPIDLMGA